MTLLEVLVAIALSAMLSAVAFPRLDSAMDAIHFAQADAMVSADLSRARARAQRIGSAAIATTSDGRAYAIDGDTPVALPDGVRLWIGPAPAVRFYRDGSSSGARMVVAGHNRRLGISVDVATGLAAKVTG